MDGSDNLILTGWGHVEYVAAAAAALKALEKDADVLGVSRRRLPELMEEIAERREGREASARRPKRIYIVGVSVSGDPARLADALRRLKARGVKTTWISALEMPEEAAPALAGLVEAKVYDASLLEAVGQALAVDVEEFVPFLKSERKSTADIRAYIAFIQAAQFYYRNYQDESLYAKAVRYIATGVKPAAWDAETKEAVAHYDRYGGRELIGKSPVMTTLQERINRVAKCDRARVLILGESGTGKETVANQIHNKSPRAKMPFVPFNCASVTKDLLEDRFFGHERGAFTNAVERTDGLFLQADGGTLFLDEIGEMPIEVQALLLRVLEGGRFMRVGGREELKCDVRLIANSWWRKFHDNRVLDEKQLAALMDYDYPGNVRELVNLLDRATALGEDDFAALMREHKEMNAGLLGGLELKLGRIPDRLDDAMKLHVRRVFEKYGQNLTRAAEALGVSRNTVRKYL